MNKHPLQLTLERKGYDLRSYSGRGMGNHYCLAVDCSDIGELVADVLDDVVRHSADHTDDAHAVSRAFQSMRTDSMGKGMIMYFPDVEYHDEDVDNEEYEEDVNG